MFRPMLIAGLALSLAAGPIDAKTASRDKLAPPARPGCAETKRQKDVVLHNPETGVTHRRWSDQVLAAREKAWQETAKETAEEDPAFKAFSESLAKFRQGRRHQGHKPPVALKTEAQPCPD